MCTKEMINKIICGDALTLLKTMDSESVHCCVTSPPYWGLRDYGVPPMIWGGDKDCEHEWGEELTERKRGSVHGANAQAGNTLSGVSGTEVNQGQFCQKCGAWRGQLGLEPTPELYVEHLAEIFREVRRVLRDDGTLWLNLGDTYCGTGNKGDYKDPKYSKGRNGQKVALNNKIEGIKPKDLVGIPWMVAFALRADGWYLRQDIIWHKPNPMPESVTDRCTKSHEYIFLLSKSQKYYYDYEAIQELATGYDGRKDTLLKGSEKYKNAVVPGETVQTFAASGHERWKFKTKSTFGNRNGQLNGLHSGNIYEIKFDDEMIPIRNKRSVWTVPTQPFSEAHFATFPPKLIEPCILAGCPVGGIVLDPFMGSGTTALVAIQNQRNYIGFELNTEYIKIANRRIANVQLMLQIG